MDKKYKPISEAARAARTKNWNVFILRGAIGSINRILNTTPLENSSVRVFLTLASENLKRTLDIWNK